MAQQHQHAIAQEVHGRLMTGDQQQDPGRDELSIRHASFGIALGRHQRQHVVSRLLR